MSIMHIFLGSDTVVPKYRKRLYGTTDLIANTGGLLGLCLGVSVLSAVEVIYYLTLRAFWKLCWKRRLREKRLAAKFIRTFYRRKPSHMAERVIQLDVNQIPVFRQPPLQTFPRTFLKNSIDCERYVNGIRVNSFPSFPSFQNGLEEKSIMFKTKVA